MRLYCLSNGVHGNKREKNWYFGTPKTESSIRNIKIGKTLVDTLKKHKKWQLENRLKYSHHFIQQYEVEEIVGKDKLRRIYSLPSSIDAGVMMPINMVCTKENGEMITPDSFKYPPKLFIIVLALNLTFILCGILMQLPLLKMGQILKTYKLGLDIPK
jgi:hypothetical protein